MDFNDYRLFVLQESLPPSGTGNMEMRRRESPFDDFDELSLTDGIPMPIGTATGSASDDFSGGWANVNLNDDGELDTESLVPASTPSNNENRMSKSLDLGHDELGIESDVTNNYSLPWQNKSRTLDSPKRSGSPSSNNGQKKSSSGSESDKLKYKLMSAWNNMKFEMKPKTQFRNDAPIWLMGQCYHCTRREQEESQGSVSQGSSLTNVAFENFRKDFISRIWFTYRKDFSAFAGSHLTTDVGWGCMLRSGQMMLAQALAFHFLGRDWRWHSNQKKYEMVFHHQIIKFFGDSPDDECPFSIHRLVQIGAEAGKKPGDWYGPASVAFVLRDAMERAPSLNALLSQICLYVAQDCTIYKQDVIDVCTKVTRPKRTSSTWSSGSSSSHSAGGANLPEDPWRAVIILIPVRLGGEVLNPIYTPCVRSMLAHDMCIGVIGGRPKHSLYFVGWQEDKLIHLDPHLCQDVVNVMDRNFALQTYHCMSPRKMAFTKMDPSCTVGFYCRTRADFIRFVRDSEQMSSPPKEKGLYPMYVFQDGRSSDLMNDHIIPMSEERYLRVRRLDKKGRPKGTPKESEDFVFL